MLKKLLSATSFVLVAVAVSWSFAQSSPSDYESATVAFDFRMKKSREGEFMKMMDVSKDLSSWQASADLPEGVDLEKVDRIFGAMSLPDDIAAFQAMTENEAAPEVLPMDLFVQLKCADEATAKAMFDDMEKKSEKVEIDGKTFLKPPADKGLSNMLMHMSDATTIEMGTRSYLLQSKRTELFSEGLAAAWKKVPNHAFRLAFDVKGENKLIAEAVEMGKTTTEDAMAKAYMDLVDNAENFRLSIDFDADNIIVFAATGVDDSQAEELRSGLDAVMGFAKIGGKQTLPMVIPDPNALKVANEVLDSLEATADGKEVKIAIPKPGAFNETVKGVVEQIKQMQQMMQQGPPPGGFQDADEPDDDDDGSDDGGN